MLHSSMSEGFRVRPMSAIAIRTIATRVRPLLGITGAFFELERLLERLDQHLGLNYDVVEDGDLGVGVEAACIPEKRLICITSSTYADVAREDPRARFTVLHEVGHFVLAHNRLLHRSNGNPIKAFENSEWQANQFAAEILMPLEIIEEKNLSTAWEIQVEFQVSYSAAQLRLAKLQGGRKPN